MSVKRTISLCVISGADQQAQQSQGCAHPSCPAEAEELLCTARDGWCRAHSSQKRGSSSRVSPGSSQDSAPGAGV